MTNNKGILIKNVYYMLSYAFQELSWNNYKDIVGEEFDDIEDLFAEILYRGVSMQLKQGLYRDYLMFQDDLSTIRGKIDLNGTIKDRIRRNNRISCQYDELSENNLFNQIIKSTIILLLNAGDVSSNRKMKLKNILPFFTNIDTIDCRYIRWNSFHYQRNNKFYKVLMNTCYYIIEGLLLTTEQGKDKMSAFLDNNMSRLFEKFVLEYYRRHHSDMNANPDQIEWQIDKHESISTDLLPNMQSDIVLKKDSRKIVIDTKYYGRMFQYQYDVPTIHSNNLYQIFTYVKNMDTLHNGSVTGILLYAQTQEDTIPNFDAILSGNRILVKSLDLNKDFGEISSQLDNIASYLS